MSVTVNNVVQMSVGCVVNKKGGCFVTLKHVSFTNNNFP